MGKPMNKDKLIELLVRESSQKTKLKAEPATHFRETLSGTHSRYPLNQDGSLKGSPRQRHSPSERKAAKAVVSPRHLGPSQEGLFPGPSVPQSHVHQLAAQRRHLKGSSQWALLDTFEAAMCNQEKLQHRECDQICKEEQKMALDAQMAEKLRKKLNASEAKVREREMIERAAKKYEQDEASKVMKKQEHLLKLKKQADEELLRAVEAQEKQKRFKMLREEQELEAIKQQLQQQKQKELAERLKQQKEMETTLQENEVRIQLKKEAAKKEAELDNKLMKETLKTLELQERHRQEALEKFHARIQARAANAGETVVADQRAREDAESKLLQKFQQERDEQVLKQERMAKEKQARLQQEVDRAIKEQQEIHRKIEEDKQREDEALCKLMKAKALQQEAHEHQKALAAREKSRLNRLELEKEIRAKEERDVAEDINMTPHEYKLNLQLVQQAKAVVGKPFIVPAMK